LLAALAEAPIVAILRSDEGRRLDAVLDALVEAGVRALEVTLPTPGSREAVASAVRRYPGHTAVGMGTVLSVDDVERAADAGASFVVTPDTDPDVVAAARRHGLDVLPGAMTPTEVRRASRAGATAVKLFPARSLGPQFVRDLRGPLPDVPLVPVGGVGLDDVAGYLSAGALAVGVGGPLVGDALAGGDLAALRARAAAFLEVTRTAAG
jgi:2-dehydro-3-deoxyphosphogluconate aldolase/(4S)-4-hydroxy-2-oxoglutarate aldolase